MEVAQFVTGNLL